MAYFSVFPKTKFLNQDITNLAIGFKIDSIIREDTYAFLNYDVESGETIDDVAYNYYGDARYAWLVIQANYMLDPYWEWPMSTYNFEAFIKKKYGSIAAAQATTIHCEHKTKNLTVSADSLTVSNGVSSSDYDAIDAYTYWDQINENRRHIKLINKVYISEIDQQLRDILQTDE